MKTYEVFQCPYCGTELSEENNACCGEAGHGEWITVDENNEPMEDTNGIKQTN